MRSIERHYFRWPKTCRFFCVYWSLPVGDRSSLFWASLSTEIASMQCSRVRFTSLLFLCYREMSSYSATAGCAVLCLQGTHCRCMADRLSVCDAASCDDALPIQPLLLLLAQMQSWPASAATAGVIGFGFIVPPTDTRRPVSSDCTQLELRPTAHQLSQNRRRFFKWLRLTDDRDRQEVVYCACVCRDRAQGRLNYMMSSSLTAAYRRNHGTSNYSCSS